MAQLSPLIIVSLSFLFFCRNSIAQDQNGVRTPPCNLKEKLKTSGQLPKINIYGEYHNYPADLKRRAAIQRDGFKGQIFWAMEGNSWGEHYDDGKPNSPSRVFGVEEKIPRDLQMLFKYLDIFSRIQEGLENSSTKEKSQAALKPEKQSFIVDFATVLGKNEAWKKTSESFFMPDQVRLANILNQSLKAGTSEQSMNSALPRLMSDPVIEKTDTFISLIKALISELLKSVEKHALTKPVVDLVLLKKTAMSPTLKNCRAVSDELVKWRNAFIQRNIMTLYCQAINEKKDVALTIGQTHIDMGLAKNLIANLKLAGINERIVEIYNSQRPAKTETPADKKAP